jgi:hypothetical protein
MNPDSISDQKRLVRGEHYKLARGLLRARDEVHQTKWRILTVSGPSPKEEIDCIRALFSHAFIVSVDIEPANTMAALAAGADDAHTGDLMDYTTADYAIRKPPAFLGNEKFDVLCLDLSGPATSALRRTVSVYWQYLLSTRGVMIVTLSYGRDVMEMYEHHWERAHGPDVEWLQKKIDIPGPIRSRLHFTFLSKTRCLQSVMLYAGKQMPMISTLLVKRSFYASEIPSQRLSFVKVDEPDYELMLTDDSRASIYACPQDRFEELRRSHIARKAVHTRQVRTEAEHEAAEVIEQLKTVVEHTAIDVAAVHANGAKRRAWAQWEEIVIKQNAYKHSAVREIAKIINRTEGAVRQKAHALGVSFRTP